MNPTHSFQTAAKAGAKNFNISFEGGNIIYSTGQEGLTGNRVLKENGKGYMSPFELADAANMLYKKKPFTFHDFHGQNSRLNGSLCGCEGNGIFRLLPLSDPNVKQGGKRYMQCTKCGGWSHL